MKALKLIAALVTAVTLAGCASIDTPSRNAPFAQGAEGTSVNFAQTGAVFEAADADYRVAQINVIVPRTLQVSEPNSYKPRGDIVWRGDLPGDRHAQVKAIFEEALARGANGVNGSVPVVLDIEVTRFHALTEKTRYSVGGVHEIEFILSMRSAETGLLLKQPRKVQADLVGHGGQRAIEEESRGLTQKVSITNHLAQMIRTELTQPEGFQDVKLGFFR